MVEAEQALPAPRWLGLPLALLAGTLVAVAVLLVRTPVRRWQPLAVVRAEQANGSCALLVTGGSLPRAGERVWVQQAGGQARARVVRAVQPLPGEARTADQGRVMLDCGDGERAVLPGAVDLLVPLVEQSLLGALAERLAPPPPAPAPVAQRSPCGP